LKASAISSKAGNWRFEHVGVNAPGKPMINARFPAKGIAKLLASACEAWQRQDHATISAV